MEVKSKREKSEQKKIQSDFIEAVHENEDDTEKLIALLKETVCEKLGFKNAKKLEQVLKYGE